VPERIKNIALVITNGGYLVAPGNEQMTGGAMDAEQQRRLWDVSVDWLERFLPGLLNEVFPPVTGGEGGDVGSSAEIRVTVTVWLRCRGRRWRLRCRLGLWLVWRRVGRRGRRRMRWVVLDSDENSRASFANV